MRFKTPCIFQSPSEKQQPEIIYTILCLRSETLTATHLLLQIELNSALTFNAAKKGQSPFTDLLARFLEEMEAHF